MGASIEQQLEAIKGQIGELEEWRATCQAARDRAEAVCEAWAEFEPVMNFSALCGKQYAALCKAHDAYRAGKGE